MTRVIAIDWSGSLVGAQRKIWIAEAFDGDLTLLERGRSRDEVASWLIAEAARGEQLIVGMDFAFSFPVWFLDDQNCRTAPDFWRMAADKAEDWLKDCDYPFWGRSGKKRLVEESRRLRQTDVLTAAKSVFQIGGAGAVGTGSLRGMPILHTLHRAGFEVWPFTATAAGRSTVLEIYPRVWSRGVNKSSLNSRRAFLDESARFPRLSREMKVAASFSEDSFDAAISALAMEAKRESLGQLAPTRDPLFVREGMIWDAA